MWIVLFFTNIIFDRLTFVIRFELRTAHDADIIYGASCLVFKITSSPSFFEEGLFYAWFYAYDWGEEGTEVFTGIVEEVGRVVNVSKNGRALLLTIQAKEVLSDVHTGDSISVNGVCLTVTSWSERQFKADVMPETYRQTNLRELQSGSPVNLERAMQAGARFGGHIVQGHVDGTGVIRYMHREENAVVFDIGLDAEDLSRFIVPKGSITLDGISLTVVHAEQGRFTVSIIPHTIAQTALQYKKVGDTINVETDIIGKYVAHLLARPGEEALSAGLSKSFLVEHGFA